MRKRMTSCLAALCALLLLSGPACARDKDEAVKIDPKDRLPVTIAAIVDMQRVLQESHAAKSVQKQLNAQRSKYQGETEKEENQLRNAEQELSHAREHLSSDVYTEREQQLRQRFLSVERHVSSRRSNLDQAYMAAMKEIESTLLDIVQSTARGHGANMVVTKQQAFWSEKPLDITD
ncbi:MAG: OmpH family outer membrane protein, partial [Alphaproteobacteria bacterium]|nr:OmpH family outer membrane protein [Alphaproteobacteria bacterium]